MCAESGLYCDGRPISKAVALMRGVITVEIDRKPYAPGFVKEGFAQRRVSLAFTERDRSQIYVEALPLLTSARARLPDIKKLAAQFAGLERKTTPGGR